jgi:hypothetical protein
MKIKSTENKDNIIKQLNRQITEIASAMIKPACLNPSESFTIKLKSMFEPLRALDFAFS